MNKNIKKISKNIVVISVTNQCNFNCKHCIRIKKESKNMDFETFKKVLDFFPKLNIVGLTGGEIFVNPYIKSFLKEIFKRNMKVTIITNGFLLSKFHNIFLKNKEKIESIGLSLDSTVKEKNDFIRKKGSFEKVKKELIFLRKNDIPCHIFFTINNLNYKEIFDIFLFARRFKSTLRVNMIKPTKTNKKFLFKKRKIKGLEEMLLKIYYLTNRNIILPNSIHSKKALCSPWKNIDNLHFVDFYGNLQLCCDLLESNNKLNYYGNIKNISYNDYINLKHKRIKKLIQSFKKTKGKKNRCLWCFKKIMNL